MKFLIKDFFSKCNQIRRKLRILSHILKTSLMENFMFWAVILLEPKSNCRKQENISKMECAAAISNAIDNELITKAVVTDSLYMKDAFISR